FSSCLMYLFFTHIPPQPISQLFPYTTLFRSHILINNTGGPKSGNILDATISEFENAFTLHVKCNHLLSQAVIPFMKHEGYGRIINIISTSVKEPIPGLGVSNTIRAAVGNWSKT